MIPDVIVNKRVACVSTLRSVKEKSRFYLPLISNLEVPLQRFSAFQHISVMECSKVAILSKNTIFKHILKSRAVGIELIVFKFIQI